MTKYIDAERLRTEIEKRFWDYGTPLHDDNVTLKVDEILSFINSLPDESINPFDTKLFQDGVKEGLRLAKESGGEPTGPELDITPLTTLGEVKSFVAASILNKKTKKIIILEDNG